MAKGQQDIEAQMASLGITLVDSPDDLPKLPDGFVIEVRSKNYGPVRKRSEVAAVAPEPARRKRSEVATLSAAPVAERVRWPEVIGRPLTAAEAEATARGTDPLVTLPPASRDSTGKYPRKAAGEWWEVERGSYSRNPDLLR